MPRSWSTKNFTQFGSGQQGMKDAIKEQHLHHGRAKVPHGTRADRFTQNSKVKKTKLK